MKLDHGRRKQVIHDGQQRADLQRPSLQADQLADRGPRLRQLVKHVIAVVQQRFARFGKDGPLADAVEQRRADFMLEQADLLAERGLGDAQFLGGAGKMQLPAQDHKIFQLFQFHEPSSLGDRHR